MTQGIIDERLTIVYDSRGHGESSGWEGSSPEVFTWEAMQNDVFTIADAYGLESFVIGGDSMTTAASVYTAMQVDHGLPVLSLSTVVSLPRARAM